MVSGMLTNDGVAQHGGHPPNTILGIHIMFNWQLSYQEVRWPVSHGYIAGSGLDLIKVACFSEVVRWPSAGFRLDRGLMSGQDCSKPVNANPDLKVNQAITFSPVQMFSFCSFGLCIWWLLKLKIVGQIYRKPYRKVTKLK